MWQRTLTLLSICSVLFFLITIALWLRSRRTEDLISYHRKDIGSVSLWSRHGRLSFWADRYDEAKIWGDNPVHRLPGWARTATPIAGSLRWPDKNPHTLGFVYATDTTGRAPYSALAIPFWSLALLTAILPAVAAARLLRHHLRQTIGLCPNCAYDLRASTGNCPECGHSIPQRSTPPSSSSITNDSNHLVSATSH